MVQTDGFQQRSLSLRSPCLGFPQNCCSGRCLGWVQIHLPWFTQNVKLKKTAVGSPYGVCAFPGAWALCGKNRHKHSGMNWSSGEPYTCFNKCVKKDQGRLGKLSQKQQALYQGQQSSMLTMVQTGTVHKENRPAHTECLGVLSYLCDVRVCWQRHTNSQILTRMHILSHMLTHINTHPHSWSLPTLLLFQSRQGGNKQRRKDNPACVHPFIYPIFFKRTLGHARYCPEATDLQCLPERGSPWSKKANEKAGGYNTKRPA